MDEVRRRSWHLRSVAALAFAVGAGVALACVYSTGAFAQTRQSSGVRTLPAGNLTLASIDLSFIYLNGTPQIFGTEHQEGCGNCPVTAAGGSSLTIWIRALSASLNNSLGYWLNISSPIPFRAPECGYTGSTPPSGWPLCPLTTSFNFSETFIPSGALDIGVPITFVIPNPAPDYPQGFHAAAAITVVIVPTY